MRCKALSALFLLSIPLVNAAPLGSVLYIGDSLSMDEFGQVAIARLEQSEKVIDYRFYAGCGSKPDSWVEQKSAYVTKCGYWYKDSNGHQNKIPWSRFWNSPVSLPFLEVMLESQSVDTLIIQLGLNMLDDQNPANGLRPTYVRSSLNKFKTALNKNPSYKPSSCYWIAPNKTSLWSTQIQEAFFQILVEELAGECNVIDGRIFTKDAKLASDGYHLHGKDAKNFANAAFDRIFQD